MKHWFKRKPAKYKGPISFPQRKLPALSLFLHSSVDKEKLKRGSLNLQHILKHEFIPRIVEPLYSTSGLRGLRFLRFFSENVA